MLYPQDSVARVPRNQATGIVVDIRDEALVGMQSYGNSSGCRSRHRSSRVSASTCLCNNHRRLQLPQRLDCYGAVGQDDGRRKSPSHESSILPRLECRGWVSVFDDFGTKSCHLILSSFAVAMQEFVHKTQHITQFSRKIPPARSD